MLTAGRIPPLARRLVSPAGFVLVVLCFLLPFVTVSCDVPNMPRGSATFTGFDLVTGGAPTLVLPATTADYRPLVPPTPVQALIVVALTLIILGYAALVLPSTRHRALVNGSVAAVAAALLVIGQVRAEAQLEAHVVRLARERSAGAPRIDPAELVETRYGCWLALTLLLAIAAGNAIALVRTHPHVVGEPVVP